MPIPRGKWGESHFGKPIKIDNTKYKTTEYRKDYQIPKIKRGTRIGSFFGTLFLLTVFFLAGYFVIKEKEWRKKREEPITPQVIYESSKSSERSSFSGRSIEEKVERGYEGYGQKDDEYEEVYKQGKELIEKFGDSYLGKGKTKNIEEAVEDYMKSEGSYEDQQKLKREILKQVPTGLPGPIDNGIKKFVDEITK
ncbi:MAG: hypothetical protein QXI41_00045 [Candidatus Pacearchaeota archaeon]